VARQKNEHMETSTQIKFIHRIFKENLHADSKHIKQAGYRMQK
jgi:hypothetical protein